MGWRAIAGAGCLRRLSGAALVCRLHRSRHPVSSFQGGSGKDARRPEHGARLRRHGDLDRYHLCHPRRQGRAARSPRATRAGLSCALHSWRRRASFAELEPFMCGSAESGSGAGCTASTCLPRRLSCLRSSTPSLRSLPVPVSSFTSPAVRRGSAGDWKRWQCRQRLTRNGRPSIFSNVELYRKRHWFVSGVVAHV